MKKTGIDEPIGIALGSGSARGVSHIGVLKALEKAGVKAGWIAGTSIGSLIGGAYAAGISTEELSGIAHKLDWKRMMRLFMPSFSPRSLISDREVNDFLESLFGDILIEDLRIPFCAVAADLVSGKRVVISEGRLTDAVRASISIPIIFKPARRNGRLLIDGGLVDPVPVESVYNLGAKFVAAVPLTRPFQGEKVWKQTRISVRNKFHFKLDYDPNLPPIFDRLSRFFRVEIDKEYEYRDQDDDYESDEKFNIISTFWQSIRVAERELTRLRLQATPPDMIISPEVESVQLWEYNRAEELIRAGEEAVERVLG